MSETDTSTEAITALTQCLQTLGRDMDRHAAPDWDEHENVFLAVNTIDALAAERDALRAENERLLSLIESVRSAIDAGRNEPLQIWRDQINAALKGAANG